MFFLDNSLTAWGVVAGTILIALLFKKILSRTIAAFFYRLLQRFWGGVERQQFISLVVQPLESFLLVLISIFAIDKLNFPAVWQATLYGVSTQLIVERIGIGIILACFTWLLLRLVDFVALVLERRANLTETQGDNQLVVFFKDFFKVAIVIIGLLAILKFCFGQAIGPLITGLGIAGAAIALASKESLENIIASFIIFFDKPFTTGDTVKVNEITGVVERIGLRSTRIRTAEKTLVTVPNKQMVDSVVDNHTERTLLRAEIKLQLWSGTSADTATLLVSDIEKLLEAKKEQVTEYAVYVKEISKNGVLIQAEYFCIAQPAENFEAEKQSINLAVKKLLELHKIHFAAAEAKA